MSFFERKFGSWGGGLEHAHLLKFKRQGDIEASNWSTHNTVVVLPDRQLTGWLPNWLNDSAIWLTDWLTYWLTDRQTDCCLTCWLVHWRIDWLAGWPSDWLTDCRTDRLTDWTTDWLTLLPTKRVTCSLAAVRSNVDWLPTDRPVVNSYIYVWSAELWNVHTLWSATDLITQTLIDDEVPII